IGIIRLLKPLYRDPPAEAGVGVGTLYRSYPDRDALLHALEYRAYGLLNQILDDGDRRDIPGLGAVREFLARCRAIGDQLILPLHGAPPLITAQAVQARREINRRLDRSIERGRTDGSVRAAVNATDIISFSAFITQPQPHRPHWPAARRAPARSLRHRPPRKRALRDPGPRGAPPGRRDHLRAPRRARTPRSCARPAGRPARPGGRSAGLTSAARPGSRRWRRPAGEPRPRRPAYGPPAR